MNGIGTATADPQTHVVHGCDETFARMLGRTTEEVVGHTLDDLLDPPDRGREGRLLDFVTGHRGTSVQRERAVADHRVRMTLTLVCDDAERPVAYLAQLEDVTALKKLEEDLMRAQRLGVLGRISGGIAHDFNNLLMGILGALSMGAADEARRLVMRGADLIGELLAYTGYREPPAGATPVDASVRAMERMLRMLVGKQIELVLALDAPRELVRVTRPQLEQVLVNLVMNARDATSPGGRIRVTTAALGDELVLTVCDSGTGIAEEVRGRVFEPFFTTKDARHGTGLGLANVKAIVDRGGGRIDFDTEVGRGTTFTVRLPLARSRADDGH